MDMKTAQERFPIGTWVRFYYEGSGAVISPIIGHNHNRRTSSGAELQTVLCHVHADSVIDCRLPPEMP